MSKKGYFGSDLENQVNNLVEKISDKSVKELLKLQFIDQHGIFGCYPYDQRLDQAALDLKLLESALIHNGLKPSGLLIERVNQFAQATGQLPGLTYEDLIYINPNADPRTFTRGAVGNSEYDFYRGHALIENNLESVIRRVKQVFFQLDQGQANIPQAILALIEGVDEFQTTLRFMQEIGLKMSQDHFSIFRKYLGSHPDRNLKGPSGNFTPSIPVLDMLIGGENLPGPYFDFLRENEMYYPRSGRKKMAEALKISVGGGSLNARCEKLGSPDQLREQIKALSEMVVTFRGFHYKGVHHQIPQAVAGHLSGTGGEQNPGQYLRDRMKMRHLK